MTPALPSNGDALALVYEPMSGATRQEMLGTSGLVFELNFYRLQDTVYMRAWRPSYGGDDTALTLLEPEKIPVEVQALLTAKMQELMCYRATGLLEKWVLALNAAGAITCFDRLARRPGLPDPFGMLADLATIVTRNPPIEISGAALHPNSRSGFVHGRRILLRICFQKDATNRGRWAQLASAKRF